MTTRGLAPSVLFGLTLAACTGDAATSTPATVRYDLTASADRAQWAAQDLAFVGVVGHYAIYKVTGAQPQLAGPTVDGVHGAAQVTALGSFTASAAASGTLTLRAGGASIAQGAMPAVPEGSCAGAGTPAPSSGGDMPADAPGGDTTNGGSWGNGCQSSLADAGTGSSQYGSGGWGGGGWGGGGGSSGWGGTNTDGGGWIYDGGCMENADGGSSGGGGGGGGGGGAADMGTSGTKPGPISSGAASTAVSVNGPVVLSLSIDGFGKGALLLIGQIAVGGEVTAATAEQVCCDSTTCRVPGGDGVVVK